MNIKLKFGFFAICVMLFTGVNAQGICNFQDEDSGISDSRQALIKQDNSKMDIPIQSEKKSILAYTTFENSEKLILMFCDESKINATDEVEVSGKGITFVKILGKGIHAKGTAEERNYIQIEFRIAEMAGSGNRVIHLKRPSMFGKYDTAYTINLQKNIRVTEYPDDLRKLESSSEPKTITLEGQGFNLISGVKKSISGLNNSLISAITIVSKTDNKIELKCTVSGSGKMTIEKFLEDYFTTPNGTVALNMKNPGIDKPVVVLDPATSSDLELSFSNLFNSGSEQLIFEESSKYKLCEGLTKQGQIRNTEIPAFTIKVSNIGKASSTPCKLIFEKGANANFGSDLTFEIPAIAPGSSKTFLIPRSEKNVCVTLSSASLNCVKCIPSQATQWNDRGVSAKITGIKNDINTNNNTISIP